MNINVQDAGMKFIRLLGKQKAIVCIAIILIVMLFQDTNFYTQANILNNLLEQVSTNAIIAFGVTLAVICRGCDLSVGSVMVTSGVISVLLINSGMNMVLAIIIAILFGSFVGFINGFLIVKQKSEAFIITLGMGMLVQGVALLLTDARSVRPVDANFTRIANDQWFGIPNIAAFMIILGVITFLILRFTSFGRNIYALGGDYEVAEHSGINVVLNKWAAFVYTGTFAAIAGVLAASRFESAMLVHGVNTPLMVNCGVVIGGTSFAGGVGGIPQSFIGILTMFLLRNAMASLGLHTFIQQLVLGIMIVSVIALDCYTEKRKKEDV